MFVLFSLHVGACWDWLLVSLHSRIWYEKVQYRATYANTGIICRDVSTVACMYMLYLLPIINDENLLDSNASLPWPTKSCELSNMSNAVFPSLSPVLCPFIIFFHLYSLLLLFLRFRKLSILFFTKFNVYNFKVLTVEKSPQPSQWKKL